MQTRNQSNSQGIDISRYQSVTDWNKVRASGKSFVFIKATEGSSIVDGSLLSHFNGAKSVGMKVGLYHFCRAKTVETALIEADFFISTVMSNLGGFDKLDIASVLDLETPEGASRQNVVAVCRAWIERVKQASGMNVILYSFPSFADTYLDVSLADVPLWIANYGTNQPMDRAGWSEWKFFQFSESGSVDGILGNVDLDEYSGNIEDYNPWLEGNIVKFTHDYQWTVLKKILQNAYDMSTNGEINPPVLSDYAWAQSAYDENMTQDDLAWLAITLWAKQTGILKDGE